MGGGTTRGRPPLPGDVLTDLLPLLAEVNSVLDPEKLLPAIARQVRRIVDYHILDIFLPEMDGTLAPALVEGYAPEVARRFRVRPGQGIVGVAAQTRLPVFVPDVRKDARYIPLSPGVVAEMAIPLVHGDRLVGVLNIEGPDVEAFTPEARTALQVIATHLAIAIANATLFRQTTRYAALLATLHDIGVQTATILDLDELLARVAELVKQIIDYEMFGILLLDPGGRELVLRKSVRFGPGRERTRIPLGEGLTGWAARHRQPVRVDDVLQDPRYLRLIPETRSELVVPLVHKDRLVGVFDLESREQGRFTDEHVQVLTPLAAQVAGAIENARLYDELVRREERLHRELLIARRVQAGLFPEECPTGPGFEASAHFLPARELGGDLYDFYRIGEGRLGLAVGDVAGKGVPAALFGAFVSGTVRARAFADLEPAALLERVNRTVRRRGIDSLFCALTYASFDFTAGRATLAGSGLPYPLHYRAGAGTCEAVPVAGLPLGTFDDTSYEAATLDLGRGDVLVFHTDGLTEAESAGSDYGARRLQDLVLGGATLPATDLGTRIVDDLGAFTGSRSLLDDVTLVVVKIR